MNDAQTSSSAELGPVGRPAEPLQVLTQEGVDGCAGMHQGIGQNGGTVCDGHTGIDCTLDVLQYLWRVGESKIPTCQRVVLYFARHNMHYFYNLPLLQHCNGQGNTS